MKEYRDYDKVLYNVLWVLRKKWSILPGLDSLMGLEAKGTQERLCGEEHPGKESNMSKGKEIGLPWWCSG